MAHFGTALLQYAADDPRADKVVVLVAVREDGCANVQSPSTTVNWSGENRLVFSVAQAICSHRSLFDTSRVEVRGASCEIILRNKNETRDTDRRHLHHATQRRYQPAIIEDCGM